MVSEAKVNGGELETSAELPPALAEKPAGLPPGKYALVGWDMDTTGRRLIDEVWPGKRCLMSNLRHIMLLIIIYNRKRNMNIYKHNLVKNYV